MLVPEKYAWRYRNLPMLIPFSARWKGSGIAQDVAPFLDEITKQQGFASAPFVMMLRL
jgi:hypothetical protein